jgi:transcriptional regulator with XRE-family HTH domain
VGGEIQRSGTDALAALLTRAREGAGLTRRDLAERAGLSYPYVSQLETGYRGPSPEAMQRLTEVLGVPVEAMVAALAERDTPHPRMPKPAQRSAPSPTPADTKRSRWIANPAWAPARAAVFAPPPSGGAISEPIAERERLVTRAHRAASAPLPRPATDTVVAEIVARLGELPPAQRLAALTEIQNQVVRTVVEDAAGPSGESDDS